MCGGWGLLHGYGPHDNRSCSLVADDDLGGNDVPLGRSQASAKVEISALDL
jgi:hypothetical protein